MRSPILLFVLLASCGGAPPAPAPAPAEPASPWTEDAARGVQDEALAGLLRDHWEHTMERSPTWASRLGDHRYDDRLSDASWEGELRDRRARAGFLARARALEGLTGSDAVTAALLVEHLEAAQGTEVCEMQRWNVSARGNPLVVYNRLPLMAPVETWPQGQALLARYRALPAHVDAQIDNLREGARQGRFANANTVQRTLTVFRDQLAQPLDEWALLAPAREAHDDWDGGHLEIFRDGIREATRDGIRPAYARYADFLEHEILPHARSDEEAGLSALPNGEACYAAHIRRHISRPMEAQELHALGLREIARVNGEMRELGQRLFGTDDLAEILRRLREDESLYFTTEDQVEQAATTALSAARERMGEYFGVLPQAPCVVERVPAYEARFTTIAYYRPPHADGSKPGEYFINTTEPSTRPRFEMQVLAYHEAIPGHHLQIAIAQELEAVPAFRRHLFLTVYAEGWALYTERLADEMGLYSGDLDRMGMLSFDAWRASRLVVDTGLHALGWSRAQAEAFMVEHTALSRNNISNEVDRYIATPGQALAYKMGQLEILRLRERARERLGERFSLPAFHDAVLTGGALTMPALETRIDAWIQEQSD